MSQIQSQVRDGVDERQEPDDAGLSGEREVRPTLRELMERQWGRTHLNNPRRRARWKDPNRPNPYKRNRRTRNDL